MRVGVCIPFTMKTNSCFASLCFPREANLVTCGDKVISSNSASFILARQIFDDIYQFGTHSILIFSGYEDVDRSLPVPPFQLGSRGTTWNLDPYGICQVTRIS